MSVIRTCISRHLANQVSKAKMNPFLLRGPLDVGDESSVFAFESGKLEADVAVLVTQEVRDGTRGTCPAIVSLGPHAEYLLDVGYS